MTPRRKAKLSCAPVSLLHPTDRDRINKSGQAQHMIEVEVVDNSLIVQMDGMGQVASLEGDMTLHRSRLTDWLAEATRTWKVDRLSLEKRIEDARKTGLDDVVIKTESAISAREREITQSIEITIQKELPNKFECWLENARLMGMEDLVHESHAAFRSRTEGAKLVLLEKAAKGTKEEFLATAERACLLGLTQSLNRARRILRQRIANVFSSATRLAQLDNDTQSEKWMLLEQEAQGLGISREVIKHIAGHSDGTTPWDMKITEGQSKLLDCQTVAGVNVPLWSMMQNWTEMNQVRKRWQRSMEYTGQPDTSAKPYHSKMKFMEAPVERTISLTSSQVVQYDSDIDEEQDLDSKQEMETIFCTPLILSRFSIQQRLGYSTSDLKCLRKLDLNKEGFTSLGEGVISKCCPKITAIACDMNRLTTLKDAFIGCEEKMKHVSARNNFILNLSGLHTLCNLEILHLDGNNIFTLDPLPQLTTEKCCVRLKELTLSCNRIARILKLQEFCPNLEVLDLASNHLVTMETALPGLKQLRVLDVGQNRLKGSSLWDELKNCPLLISLVASRNRLVDLPSFPGSVLLRELWLNGNSIRKLSSGSWMPSLQRLYLQDNSIEIIEPLWGCPALEVLDLSFNLISDLTQLRHLSCFISLRSLQLNDNPVSEQVDYVDTVLKAIPWLVELDNEAITESTKDEVVKTIFLHVMEVIGMQYLHEKAARTEICFTESEIPDEVQMITIRSAAQNHARQWFHHFPGVMSADERSQTFGQQLLSLRCFWKGSACWSILWASLIEALQFENTRATLALLAPKTNEEHGLCLSTDIKAKLSVLSNMQMCLRQREKLLLASKDLSDRDGLKASAVEDHMTMGKSNLDICFDEHLSFLNIPRYQLEDKAASVIQAVWKRKIMKNLLVLSISSYECVAKLQALWRGYSLRKKMRGAFASSKYVDDDSFEYTFVDEDFSFSDSALEMVRVYDVVSLATLNIQDITFDSASSVGSEDHRGCSLPFPLDRTIPNVCKEAKKNAELVRRAEEWSVNLLVNVSVPQTSERAGV